MSQFDVDIQSDVPVVESLVKLVLDAATASLHHEGAKTRTALTILLTGDDRIQQLNRDFMGQDVPTDVLSFPAGKRMPGMEMYLGDIAISVVSAERQAAEAGHSLAFELQLLVVHAVLHLMGYDHADTVEKAAMWTAQTTILDQLGEHMGIIGKQ